ncbi:MAG: diguanylate cyclase [Eubacteriales bacterium]|nr:diguanylate cyclase [Eubacteriales bacterium]
MKQNRRIIAMLFLLFFSAMVLLVSERSNDAVEREQCFERLTEYTEQIGNEIRQNYTSDKAYLEKAAETFAEHDLTDYHTLGKFLEILGGNGMLSEVRLLLPGNCLLTENGDIRDISGQISFQEEEKKGNGLSQRMEDFLNPGQMILQLQVPVIQDGKTAALLWGIMDLADFPNLFTVQGYGEEMQLFVIEGASGNFLLDTWHEELTNVELLASRKPQKGYSTEKMHEDIKEGNAGTTVFLSQKAGEYFYTYYCPVGVEDWMIMVTVRESVVFSHAQQIQDSQIKVMVTLLAVFLIYLIWLLYDVKREKLTNEKQLRRVSYLLDVEKELFSAFIEPHHFVNGLQIIAEYAAAETAFFWVSGRLEKGECRMWTSKETGIMRDDNFSELFPGISAKLQEKESLLIHDPESCRKEYPAEAELLSKAGIHNMMLLLVKRLNGDHAGVLGVYNMKHSWEDVTLLEQVSLTLSMTLDYYNNYRNLIKMGNVDSLTGLLNRNSYHKALDQLKEEEGSSLACVYIDVNGLHEINNYLGHQAGDTMLKRVADILRECFPEDGKYRIGGDEFVVLCRNLTEEEVGKCTDAVRQKVKESGYEISAGISWRENTADFTDLVNEAEAVMQQDKKKYYKENGGVRQKRELNRAFEQIMSEKQDMDTFLGVLASRFKGVYFVNLNEDRVRHIFIPDYFEQMLKESDNKFSRAMMLYVQEAVEVKYAALFETVCDYEKLKEQLKSSKYPDFIYRKKDGVWMKLQILSFQENMENAEEVLWIFTELNQEVQAEER